MKDQFYITLPSNSSMKFFPNNTTARYTTQLPRRIELVGEWEVALVEIQYPLTLQNINEPYNVVRFHVHRSDTPAENLHDIPTSSGEKRVAHGQFLIEPGIYTDIWEIIRALNSLATIKEHLEFGRADSADDRLAVVRKCSCKDGHYLSFSGGLRQQLGFPKLTSNIRDRLVADYPLNLHSGIPSQMFVYTDLAEPRIVGDVYAPLLRIVRTVGKNFHNGVSESKSLAPPHYVPLLLTNFRTIEIDIRDSQGRPMPFTRGTLTATLHFKRSL